MRLRIVWAVGGWVGGTIGEEEYDDEEEVKRRGFR